MIALAVIGLICIGLLGLSFALMRLQSNLAQGEVAQAPTAPLVIPTLTPTPTITPIPPTPTNTPEPTSTPTLVVNPNAQQVADDQRPTEVPLTTNPFVNPADTPAAETEGAEAPPVEPDTQAAPTTESDTQAAPTTEPGLQEAPPVAAEVTPTSTRVVQTPTAVALAPGATVSPAQIPQGGGVLPAGNSYLLWAGLGVLLLLIWGLVNYLRSPSSLSGR